MSGGRSRGEEAPAACARKALQEGARQGGAVESDMFAALGLAYVPFHMRWWYNYE